MNNITIENKGTITLGEKVMVSDPCYGLGTWCQGVLENVLPGVYDCNVEYSDEDMWEIRVSAIEVTHESCKGKFIQLECEDFEVGVDSGQAGIFDYEYYAKYHKDSTEREHVDDDWYDMVCNKTGEYLVNPDYVPFVSLVEYKAAVWAFRTELDELKKKYPELDVDTVYMETINYYHRLTRPYDEIDFNEIVDSLNNLKEALSKDPEDVIKTEGEKALEDIDDKYFIIIHKILNEYNKDRKSQKERYRSTGNTTDGLGFVSSSGFGDGVYNCWTARNQNGKIVAIRVEFISEDDYNDEEDYEEE